MLQQAQVPRYLLDHRLLDARALVEGDVVVRDASSRNRNYRVEATHGPSFLLKQATSGDTAATLANEAAVYEAFARDTSDRPRFLPKYYGFDAREGLLIVELVPDATSLRDHYASTGRFSIGPGASIGTALGELHRRTLRATESAPQFAAWVLSVHRPDSRLFRDASSASLDLIRILQKTPRFGEKLDALREAWALQALIHADVKWDNCLVTSGDSRDETVTLIDWESSTLGDPCWDIGSALSQFLSFWLFSIPVTGRTPPERFPELASYPLDLMKPAIGACWIAYMSSFPVGASESERRLVRAVEFAAARLVQTAFEATQHQQQITSSVVLHLQLALNILERPREAASSLLGLRASVGHP